jgi:hypothetical protein
MAVTTNYGSRIVTGLVATPTVLADAGEGGGRLKYWCDTVELAASDATSTIHLARIPSNARIAGISKLYFDDLASSGSPTLDIGVYPIRSADFTADPDALNDGIDVATAAGSAAVVKDIANYGKRLWEIAGLTADPKCDMDIKVAVLDAATNATGTVTLELFYAYD